MPREFVTRRLGHGRTPFVALDPAKPVGHKIYAVEYAPDMTNAANQNRPERKTAWNTYYPWALALYGIVSAVLIVIVFVSWIPAPEIPGVPASEQSVPVIPGLLGVFFIVMAIRQISLRNSSR